MKPSHYILFFILLWVSSCKVKEPTPILLPNWTDNIQGIYEFKGSGKTINSGLYSQCSGVLRQVIIRKLTNVSFSMEMFERSYSYHCSPSLGYSNASPEPVTKIFTQRLLMIDSRNAILMDSVRYAPNNDLIIANVSFKGENKDSLFLSLSQDSPLRFYTDYTAVCYKKVSNEVLKADFIATFTDNSKNKLLDTYITQFIPSTGNASSYKWDFGDGNTSTLEAPRYIYKANGKYLVTLTVTNQNGLTDSITNEITVNGVVGEYIFWSQNLKQRLSIQTQLIQGTGSPWLNSPLQSPPACDISEDINNYEKRYFARIKLPLGKHLVRLFDVLENGAYRQIDSLTLEWVGGTCQLHEIVIK